MFDCSANLWQNIDEAKEKCGFEQMSSILKLNTAFKAEIVLRFGLRFNLCAFIKKTPQAFRCLWLNSAEHVGPCPQGGRFQNFHF